MCRQVPNGELTSEQLRHLGNEIAALGPRGCGDITTRANIQLRGMDLAESAGIFEVLILRISPSGILSGVFEDPREQGPPATARLLLWHASGHIKLSACLQRRSTALHVTPVNAHPSPCSSC